MFKLADNAWQENEIRPKDKHQKQNIEKLTIEQYEPAKNKKAQRTTLKTEIKSSQIPLILTKADYRCPERVSRSCSTCDTRRIDYVRRNSVMSTCGILHSRKRRCTVMAATIRTYPSSSVKKISNDGQRTHDSLGKKFERTTAPYHLISKLTCKQQPCFHSRKLL